MSTRTTTPDPNPPAPLLRVADLSYAAGGKTILAGVSFAMAEGEVRAVIGPNGAGKSTLCRLVAGLAEKDGGRVELAGRDADAMSRRETALAACLIPQIQGDLPAFAVRDCVMMGRYPHADFWRGPGPADAEAVDAALNLAGVAHLAERLLPTLSGGERQLVSIASGLAQESRLLVLDEPSSFLDPARRDALFRLIRRLNRERGLSFLVVTHDVNMAMFLADRVLALRDGRTVFEGPAGELARPGLLRDIYGVDFALLPPGPDGRRLALSPLLAEAATWT